MGLEEWSGGETETPSLRYHYVYPPDLLPTPPALRVSPHLRRDDDPLKYRMNNVRNQGSRL